MYIKQTHSTSTLLREQYSLALPHLYTIRTDYQTAGRGQAGNGWESEEGKNLLFSALLRYPEVKASEQWRLSMLVAVGIREVLAALLPDKNMLRIKWPNDIYYGDKKLVGILIENSLQGAYLDHSIVGIGVNLNQTQWRSNAPNPVSMKQITGVDYEPEQVLGAWIAAIKRLETESTEHVKQAYMQHLYRSQGWHPYMEREVSTQPTHIAHTAEGDSFLAKVVDISPQGELLLQVESGEEKRFHFKQIRFVINH